MRNSLLFNGLRNQKADEVLTKLNPKVSQRRWQVPLSVTAPSIEGTYYFGACVASVTGESTTTNNCSSGVWVMVE